VHAAPEKWRPFVPLADTANIEEDLRGIGIETKSI
jgi:hypothetical protein